MNECQRLHPITPFGIPRAVVKDDTYMGFRIPTDAIIIANQCAIHMDPEIYKEPNTFLPRCWIDDPSLPELGIFGYGKTICPGRHIAGTDMFLAMASTAWAFNFEKKPGISDEPGLNRSMPLFPQTSGV